MKRVMSALLNNGARMPLIGLGTWQSEPSVVGLAVDSALRAGYKHIDCAHAYENEGEVGVALQKCFKEGVVQRDQLFVTSKLWSSSHAPEDVIPAFELTLQNLQLEYLDLYLIHWPVSVSKGALCPYTEETNYGYSPERIAKCWKCLESLVDKGLCRAIGISNFTITKTENLLKTARIVPAVNQVECHPFLQQQKLKDYCDKKGIVLEAYSPLGSPGRPDIEEGEPEVLDDPTIQAIAKKHKATPAQVCLAYLIQRGIVAIPKSVNPSRITENLDSTKLTLDDQDREKISELNQDFRFCKGEFLLRQGETLQDLWDEEEDMNFSL